MTVTTENGEEYTCERVVLAVPPNMTGKVKGQLRSHLGLTPKIQLEPSRLIHAVLEKAFLLVHVCTEDSIFISLNVNNKFANANHVIRRNYILV